LKIIVRLGCVELALYRGNDSDLKVLVTDTVKAARAGLVFIGYKCASDGTELNSFVNISVTLLSSVCLSLLGLFKVGLSYIRSGLCSISTRNSGG